MDTRLNLIKIKSIMEYRRRTIRFFVTSGCSIHRDLIISTDTGSQRRLTGHRYRLIPSVSQIRFLWFGFSFKNWYTNFNNAIVQTMAATRNKTQKLSKPSCRKDTEGFGSGLVSGSGQLSSIGLNHAFSSWFALFDSSTFRMALEISATRGDPMGKTCRRNLWF